MDSVPRELPEQEPVGLFPQTGSLGVRQTGSQGLQVSMLN